MKFERRRSAVLNLIAASTAFSGLLTLSTTLFALVHLHRARIAIADAHLTVIAGLSLIYLATLLRRGKHNAWLVSVLVYGLLTIRNTRHFIFDINDSRQYIIAVTLSLLVPLLTLIALIIFRKMFEVRSEIHSFKVAARRAVIILIIAFLYGVIGFQLFDERDYHQEISVPTSIHYTVDQSGFTTSNRPIAYTKRARFFVDSLAAISITSVFYAGVSFFAPIRFRLSHHIKDLQDAEKVLKQHSLTSEDFFKLWPRDKDYFFSADRSAFLAYQVKNNVALVVGDPVGPSNAIKQLMAIFMEYCRINDWLVAFIHTDATNLKLYASYDFSHQKIGEEALVDINHFVDEVARNKYFRHINNKFSKQNYTFEVLQPPHAVAVVASLKRISDDWLSLPGRTERGFMMGYFSEAYIQNCPIAVVRDDQMQIRAFANQVLSFKADEANYDLLRQAHDAQSNTNDYLMINFISYLKTQGFNKINMGLSPLSGLEASDDTDRTAMDRLLHFVYANADRFYSFQGLARFKLKYEPEWESRYIVYRGGLPGFSKAMNALLRAMNDTRSPIG